MTQPLGSGLNVHLDTTELRQFYAQLKTAGATLPREWRKALKTASQPAVNAVKSSASWSRRIPGAVATRVSFGKDARVEIYVNARKAPEGAPLDNRGRSGHFRHPVYAHGSRSAWTWTEQPARPFLEQPVTAQLPQVEAGLLDATMNVLRKAGFR